MVEGRGELPSWIRRRANPFSRVMDPMAGSPLLVNVNTLVSWLYCRPTCRLRERLIRSNEERWRLDSPDGSGAAGELNDQNNPRKPPSEGRVVTSISIRVGLIRLKGLGALKLPLLLNGNSLKGVEGVTVLPVRVVGVNVIPVCALMMIFFCGC